MEKDYSKFRNIKIEELQIKFIDTNILENYSEIFKNLNIKTLEDLLIENDKKTFDNRKKQENITIKGMCDLLKYIYLKEPLEQGIRLEDEMNGETNKFFNSLRRLGFSKKEEIIIRNFYKDQLQTIPSKKIIDILKLFFKKTQYQGITINQKEDTTILNNINSKILYLTSYYKKTYQEDTKEKLIELNKRKEELIKQKQQIEKELFEIEQQIIIEEEFITLRR